MKKKKVIVFDFWAYYSPHLEVMAAVARREANAGADVLYFACDGSLDACEVDPWGTKIACINCRKRTEWAGATVEIRQIKIPLSNRETYELDKNQLQSLQSYHYRGVNVGMGCASSYISRTRDQELIKNEVTIPVLSRQLLAAKRIVDSTNAIIDEHDPDVVCLFNGRGFINRAILGVCESRGVRYVTVEVGANDERVEEYSGSLPHSISARTEMMRKLWQSANVDERLRTAHSFYYRKRAGEVTNDKSYVSKQLKGLLPCLPQGKEIVAIFNSSDDEVKSIGDEWSLSADVNQYEVVYSLLKAAESEDTFFILRMHPNLATVGAPWVRNWDKLRGLANCMFIDASSPISSYEVLDVSSKVLVFGSTIGAEAVAAGKPVVLYGNAYYERLDICYRANDLSQLIDLCGQPLAPKNPEPALMYGYYMLKSGDPLEGYAGDKREQRHSLMGKVVPFRQSNGWRGRGFLLYALNYFCNRWMERKIRKSIVGVDALRRQAFDDE